MPRNSDAARGIEQGIDVVCCSIPRAADEFESEAIYRSAERLADTEIEIAHDDNQTLESTRSQAANESFENCRSVDHGQAFRRVISKRPETAAGSSGKQECCGDSTRSVGNCFH